jgi:hypothetical protein
MNKFVTHIIRFVVFVLVQALILNHLEFGWGILIMVYPLFIFLLPNDLKITFSLIIAFSMGFAIDLLSDTFGIHASALVVFAYLKPLVFARFAKQDNYENLKEANIYTMGTSWFIYTFGILLFFHHLWFFLFEIANFGEIIYIFQKTVLSLIVSFLFSVGLQIIFVPKPKER